MKLTGVFSYYRFFTGEKVGTLRLGAYALLGLFLNGRVDLVLWLLDLGIVLGGLMFAGLLNDYWDYRLLGEPNAIGTALKNGRLQARLVHLMIWLPWLLALGLFVLLGCMISNPLPRVLLWISFLLCFLYCAPPVRLKSRRIAGILAPPAGIFLLYLQGLFLLGKPSGFTYGCSLSVFIFCFYLEFIHAASDSRQELEVWRMRGELAMPAARITCLIGAFSMLIAGMTNPVFLAGTICWIGRWMALRGQSINQLMPLRRTMISPLYHVEEFGIYTVIAVLNGLFAA